MPLYELGLVMSADLDAEERDAFLAELRAIVEGGQATMVKEDVWGKRTLAYEIDHKREGFYVFWQFEGSGAVIKPLEYKLRLSDQVLRFLTLNLDVEMRRKRKFDKKRAEQRARKRSEEAAAAEVAGAQEA
jgi:small subunit ribosomal protein S6